MAESSVVGSECIRKSRAMGEVSFRLLRSDCAFPLNFLSLGLLGVELSLESIIVLFELLDGVGGGVFTRFGEPFGKTSASGCVNILVGR